MRIARIAHGSHTEGFPKSGHIFMVHIVMLPSSRKNWWIDLNQREQKYWQTLIRQIAEFDLATPRICLHMHSINASRGIASSDQASCIYVYEAQIYQEYLEHL